MIKFRKTSSSDVLANAQEAAQRLPEIAARAARVAHGLTLGTHGRRQKGQGDDFWQFRQYDPQSDSAGRIDWRRSARGDTLHVREKEDMRPHTIQIWLDTSPSMFYTSDPKRVTKFEYGLTTASILGILYTQAGERVISADKAAVATQPQHLIRFQHALIDDHDLNAINVGARSDVILISDGFSFEETTIAALRQSVEQRDGRLSLLRIYDPQEEVFEFNGHIRFEAGEKAPTLETQNAASLQADYKVAYLKHITGLEQMFPQKRLFHFATAQDYADTLSPYLLAEK